MTTDVKPLGGWDYRGHPKLIWYSTLDERYLIEVVRTSERLAQLRIFDDRDDPKVIYDEPTSLSYGAQFGPDVEDVVSWQETAEEVVDAQES